MRRMTVPLLVVGGLLTWFAIVDDNGFAIVWRYFSWSNQMLATIALWTSTAYLFRKGKYRFGSLLKALPAAFMTAVSLTSILTAPEGFRWDHGAACVLGATAAAMLLAHYLYALCRSQRHKVRGEGTA